VSIFLFTFFASYPIGLSEFFIYRRTKIRPPVRRRIELVFQPAFRLARPQEIESRQKSDEREKPERKSERDVIKPQSERERQKISRGGWNKNEFPVALINAEPFQVAENVWSR